MPRYYVSGPSTGSDRYLREEAKRSTHRLFSLHGNYINDVLNWVEKAKQYDNGPDTILLDSGAFTAWNKGYKTSLQEVINAYRRFLVASEGMFREVWGINLDVIPGEAGRDPTPEEIHNAVIESDENLKILQDTFGDRILPVFHQGESNERLHVVKAQAKFICISPRNDLPEKQRVVWAQEVHMQTTGNMTHGLATTGAKMITVPWFSVDSATARHAAAYGKLIFNIDNYPKQIFITRDSNKHKDINTHYDTLNEYARWICDQKIKADIFTHQELLTYFGARVLFNIKELSVFMQEAKVYNYNQQSLFGI